MSTPQSRPPFINEYFLDNSPEEMAAWTHWCEREQKCHLKFPPAYHRELSCRQIAHCITMGYIKPSATGVYPSGKHTFEAGAARCLDCGVHREEIHFAIPIVDGLKMRCMGEHPQHDYNTLGLCNRCHATRKRNLAAHKSQKPQ